MVGFAVTLLIEFIICLFLGIPFFKEKKVVTYTETPIVEVEEKPKKTVRQAIDSYELRKDGETIYLLPSIESCNSYKGDFPGSECVKK